MKLNNTDQYEIFGTNSSCRVPQALRITQAGPDLRRSVI